MAHRRFCLNRRGAHGTAVGPSASGPTPGDAFLPPPDHPSWSVAQLRLAAIRPLLGKQTTNDDFAARSRETGHSVRSLRRWVQRHREKGFVGLLPILRSGKPQPRRLHPEVEAIIEGEMLRRGLTHQRRRVSKIHRHVIQACTNLGLPAPDESTVRRRVRDVPPAVWTHAREGARAANEIFDPLGPAIQGADCPLALVQMDHMRLDIEVVQDDDAREPMGKPWLTVAIDIYSRVVLGFYLSILDPNSASTGFCLVRALLPKDRWLALMDVTPDWPFHGPIRVLHTDNGADFHSKALERACDLLGITQHFRKPGSPQHGAHIERLLGSFAGEIHTLPGTTFRAPHVRGEYDSVGKAAYTIPELERYIAIYIARIYHHTRHRELGVSPYVQYQTTAPYQAPAALPDDRTLRIHLLPFRRLSVQRYGLQLFGRQFYDGVLRRWIGVRRPEKFCVSYDPRDLRVVYFHDPELGQYFDIPLRNLRASSASLKLIQGTVRKITPQGARIDPGHLTVALNELDAMTASSQSKTRRARRDRAAGHKPPDTEIPPAKPRVPTLNAPVIDLEPVDGDDPIAPFPVELWAPKT